MYHTQPLTAAGPTYLGPYGDGPTVVAKGKVLSIIGPTTAAHLRGDLLFCH